MEFKYIVLFLLLLIVLRMGRALFHLSSNRGNSRGLVRALGLRIGLSIALFALLIVGYFRGWIEPLSAAHHAREPAISQSQ